MMSGLDRLRARLQRNLSHPEGTTMTPVEAVAAVKPQILLDIPADRTVIADVRDELKAGREPFGLIMDARSRVPTDGALCVRAIFEPVPLYAVMQRQGLTHWTEQLGDEDWAVWFYRDAPADREREPSPSAEIPNASVDEDVVILDVRGLEPPEPMVRTLAALEQLGPGRTLIQVNTRVPQFLLPVLDERGFSYEVREQGDDVVRLFIRRSNETHGRDMHHE